MNSRMLDGEGIPSRVTDLSTARGEGISRRPEPGAPAGQAGRWAAGWRLACLALGVVAAAVVVTTLSLRGLSFVNLDSLLAAPLLFQALLVLPAALAPLLLAAATLPRTVLINLAVLAGLIASAEVATWVLTPTPVAIHGEPEVLGGATFYVPDATLGYGLAPSVVARHQRMVGDEKVYDVTYEIDDRGRRHTPTNPGPPRRSFLLLFGDSNTFGEGLGQTGTLSYYAGQLAAGHRPYNYGVPGYGPQHMLELVQVRRFAQEVPEPEGYAVFFLIPAHIARVIGSSKVSTGWGRHFPYYEVGSDGDLAATGDFVHGRPLTTLAYHFWNKSNLAAALDVDLPPRYTKQDYRLTARILAEGGHQLARQVRLHGFYVILGQAYNDPQLRVLQELRDALAREGVPYLDYARLLDVRDPTYRISEFDAHNSATANRAIAARLVSDLRIAR